MRRAAHRALLTAVLILGCAGHAQAQATVSFALPTGNVFSKFRGLVGDAPYILELAASGDYVQLTWKVDELETNNPGDQGDQALVLAVPGGRFEYPARQARRVGKRGEDGSIYAIEEEYQARIPADEYRKLAAAPQLEMRIRGKTFKLGPKEMPKLQPVLEWLAAPGTVSDVPSAPAAPAKPAAASPYGPADIAIALYEVESAQREAPLLGEADLPAPLESPVWEIHSGMTGGKLYLLTAQRDTWTEGTDSVIPQRPLLMPGDTVSLLSRSGGKRLPVVARVYGGPGDNAYCNVLLEPSGWAYFLQPETLRPRDGEVIATGPALGAVLPVRYHSVSPVRAVPAATARLLAALHYRAYKSVQDSLRKNYHRPQELPEIWTPTQLAELSEVSSSSGTWDTPAGPLSILSASMHDDPSDHGQESYVTFLVRADGTVLHRIDGRYHLIAAADLDGDGTAELIFEQGIAFFRDGRWTFPKPGNSEYCD